MPALFRFSAILLTLALTACAGHHAHEAGAADGASADRSGVEFYGEVDAGIGSERIH